MFFMPVSLPAGALKNIMPLRVAILVFCYYLCAGNNFNQVIKHETELATRNYGLSAAGCARELRLVRE